MKKIALGFLIAMVLISGCTGSFKVTKAVYKLHREQRDKWMDELVFIVCILPYGVAALSDAVIFNTIEFWTGKNPVVSETGDHNSIVIVKNGNSQATLAYDATEGTVEVDPGSANGKSFTLARTPEGVVATDHSGKIMFISIVDEHGGVTVYNADHQVVRHFTPGEVSQGRLDFFQN
jgi:hypothetical protein